MEQGGEGHSMKYLQNKTRRGRKSGSAMPGLIQNVTIFSLIRFAKI
jgi:hypothetical protein